VLCFNYTVGFSWSVAVLNRPLWSPPNKDHHPHAWHPKIRQHSEQVSMNLVLHGRPEPLFIPRLQSRFADFPYLRYLLTKGYMP
jgi:hypothetical protein